MGTCGGAASSFLVSQRAAVGRPRPPRLSSTAASRDLFQRPGRALMRHLMLFQARVPNYGFCLRTGLKVKLWEANYCDANGNKCYLGLFDDQESAALAVNAAIRTLPPAVQRRRKTNPVVDGQLVPRARKMTKKRRRDEPAATPSPRARRPRRAVNYDDSEPDADDDEDGWD